MLLRCRDPRHQVFIAELGSSSQRPGSLELDHHGADRIVEAAGRHSADPGRLKLLETRRLVMVMASSCAVTHRNCSSATRRLTCSAGGGRARGTGEVSAVTGVLVRVYLPCAKPKNSWAGSQVSALYSSSPKHLLREFETDWSAKHALFRHSLWKIQRARAPCRGGNCFRYAQTCLCLILLSKKWPEAGGDLAALRGAFERLASLHKVRGGLSAPHIERVDAFVVAHADHCCDRVIAAIPMSRRSRCRFRPAVRSE
jgi:hypothetical protein